MTRLNMKWCTGMLIGALLAYLSFIVLNTARDVPSITIQDLNGHSIAIKELRGKPVLINFWATSCPGCIREMPNWVDIHRKYHDRGLTIVAVAMSYDTLDFVKAFVSARHLPFTVVFDTDGAVAKALARQSVDQTRPIWKSEHP